LANRAIIAPSILSADFAHLAREIEMVEKGGADLLHLDIMDGHFAPNITIGPPVVASIRRITKLPLDAHLMIEDPGRYVDALIQAGVNWISVHAEADVHLSRTIQHIQSQGVRAGVAINPATPIGRLEEVLADVDFVLVMSVNPGFGGQRFIPSALHKIRKLKAEITSNKCRARIEVDGGIDIRNLNDVLAAGADVIVAGSAIFNDRVNAFDALREMKTISDRYSDQLEVV
jgi:ribulose-phosphate 3-epimerase